MQMKKWIPWVCCLSLFGVSSMAQDEEFEVFALAQMEAGNFSSISLHKIDPKTGQDTLIGETGFSDCFGLQEDQKGDLYSVCLQDDIYRLVRIDRNSGQGQPGLPIFPRIQLDQGIPFRHMPLDLVLTQDRFGVIRSFREAQTPILPPGGQNFEVYDRASGTLVVSASTRANRIAAPISGDEVPALLFSDQGVLTRLDLQTAQQSITFQDITFPIQTRSRFRFLDFDQLPGSSDFLSLAFVQLNNDTAFLVWIDGEDGHVSILERVSRDMRYLTISEGSDPPVEPEGEETIIPILENGRAMNGTFSTHLALINSDGTAEQPFLLEFFESGGMPIQPDFALCPGQGAALEAPLPANQLLALDLSGRLPPISGGSSLVSGWARMRADDALTAFAEVLFANGSATNCGRLGNSLPAEDIQATVRIPAVRPALRWMAEGVIAATRESALSLVNPDPSETAMVTVTALNADGTPFDINEFQIGPEERISGLLFDLLNRGKVFILPPQRPDKYRGRVTITSDRPIAVGGLFLLLPEGRWLNLSVNSIGEEP